MRLSAAATARKERKKWEKPLTPKYDPDNIFAKILRGEAPCVKVYEDNVSLAFMDVMPRIEGHTLVIPKAPARTLFDLDPKDLALLMPAVQKVGRAVMAGMKAEGLLLQQFNEPASGQQVFHLHFHLLPCWTGVAIRPPGGPFQSAETLKPHADKIVAALAGV
jgi:histidine triad (HIT) family protein